MAEDKSISRVVYVVLAIFLGTIGVHNFVAGYYKAGIVQLFFMAISFGALAPLIFAWNIFEIVTVVEDGEGRNFR